MSERVATRFPRRRLLPVSLAAVGALVLIALAGCRVQPGTAAYVGDTRYTIAQVDTMFGEFSEAERNKEPGPIRQFLVEELVIRDVARKLAAENHLRVPAPPLANFASWAQPLGLPPTGKVVHLYAETGAAMSAISSLGKDTAPTEADRREVFAQLVNQGIATPDQYGQYHDQLDFPALRTALGLRSVLAEAVQRYKVSVNPLYQPVGIPVPIGAGGQLALILPLTPTASPAVTDASPGAL